MKKRTFLPVILVVMLILSITSLYITPVSACWEKPRVKIWKKFVDDPLPSYRLGTECHWDIEIGVWTSVFLKSARVYDRFGAELKIDNIQTPDETYTFTYHEYEDKYPTKQAYVSINGGDPHKLDWRGVTFGKEPYKFRIYWTGKTHKIHFKWYIGELEADETITILLSISTDLNPGGKQEYTSPCEHCINSGATLIAKYKCRGRCMHACRWRWICTTSEKLCIKVQCEEPLPSKLILDKFNDTNGDGKYDAGDVKIVDWPINVIDSYGGTTTYLTPKVVDITEFGTYTITEDLPGDWEQTALRVDGDYKPPTVSWTMTINEGETHDVLYGNKETAPPVPPKIEIGLGIYPNIQHVGSNITFSWNIDSPPEATPVKVELKLIDPYGVETILYTGTTFPDDLINSKTWTATGPTGSWKARVIYYYKSYGFDMTAKATQGFVVIP